MTALVHHATVGALMFYKVTLMSEVTITKRFLAFVFSGLTVTDHMVVQLASEGEICLADSAFKLSIFMDVLVEGIHTGGTEKLFTLFTL